MNHPITTTDAVATWKLAHRFVLDVYRMTERLPQSEQTSLTPKIRSSVVKVASNIVEGYARKDSASYLNHLSDSQVSLEETKYALLVARDLGYISEAQYDTVMTQAEDVSERLEAMQAKLTVTTAATEPNLEPATEETLQLKSGGNPITETAGKLWNWVTGSSERLRSKQTEEPNIWTEDPPLPDYLEAAKNWNLEETGTPAGWNVQDEPLQRR
jgi:four helix bundle protein